MKSLIAVVIAAAPAPHACAAGVVEGSGQAVTVSRWVDGFDQIDFRLPGTLHVTIGERSHVTISADDNIAPMIRTDVEKGRLTIRTEARLDAESRIEVRLVVPELTGLAVGGAAQAFVAKLDNEAFGLAVEGPAGVHLAGRTGELAVGVHGPVRLRAFNLEARSANVSIQGPGSAEFSVSERLNVAVTGYAAVTYKGSPKVRSSVRSGGTIDKVES